MFSLSNHKFDVKKKSSTVYKIARKSFDVRKEDSSNFVCLVNFENENFSFHQFLSIAKVYSQEETSLGV